MYWLPIMIPLKKRFALALELAPVKYQHLSLLTLKEVF
jgi:hypothetical protein